MELAVPPSCTGGCSAKLTLALHAQASHEAHTVKIDSLEDRLVNTELKRANDLVAHVSGHCFFVALASDNMKHVRGVEPSEWEDNRLDKAWGGMVHRSMTGICLWRVARGGNNCKVSLLMQTRRTKLKQHGACEETLLRLISGLYATVLLRLRYGRNTVVRCEKLLLFFCKRGISTFFSWKYYDVIFRNVFRIFERCRGPLRLWLRYKMVTVAP